MSPTDLAGVLAEPANETALGQASAKRCGWRKESGLPVHVAADLSPQQARTYRLADNRIAEAAETIR